MAKSKKQILYAYHIDDTELNKRFYQRFDANLLFNKAIALACILEDEDEFKSLTTKYSDIEPSRINDKFFETLRAEIHLTEIHQFEGFFALLIAIFQDLPHWIYLTAYHTSSIADAINLFIKGDITLLTDGIAKNEREFVSMAVYATYQPQEEPEKEKWEENLDNIAWLIRHMAEKYIAGKGEYNSYKHGVRVMTGESSIGFGLNDPAGDPVGPIRTIAHSKDAFGYLELQEGVFQTIQDPTTKQTVEVFKPKIKKDDKGEEGPKEKDERVIKEVEVQRVYEKSKFFSPKQSMAHLSFMNRLLATVKSTRLTYYTDQAQLTELTTFFDLDKAEILALREKYFESRFSI